MKTFLVAQHHGAFLTLNSMAANGIKDVTVIIPGSQVDKYNKMYSENPTNPEFSAFKDYDKKISAFLKENNLNFKAYVVDDFDIKNTLVSTLRVIKDLECHEIIACIMSGALINKDYRQCAKEDLGFKTFGFCYSRVYHNHHQLSMYHMIGLPQHDGSLDLNFGLVDVTKVNDGDLQKSDSQLLSEATKRKELSILNRQYNGKDDPLIGTAISARQTIAHNLKIQSGNIINLWNKCIKPNSALKSEEIYGYPFNIYSDYCTNLSNYLPKSTLNKIVTNGKETAKWTSGLYECLDIIDL